MLLAFMDRRSNAFVILFCALLEILVAFIDVVTGPQISSAIFYLLPISLCAWYLGLWPGVFMALVSAALWYSADITSGDPHSHGAIAVWNALTRFGFFLILVILLSTFHKLLKEEKERAVTDSLTGVANYRAFVNAAEQEFARCRRYRHPFSVAFIDLDNFKHINDAFGHTAGDILLRRTAQVMRHQTRATDVVARLGGDEFLILFVETGADEVKQAIEELRRHLLAAMKEAGWPVTFSIGVLTYSSPPANIQSMVSEVDRLMYSVKKHGKNGFAHAIADSIEKSTTDSTAPV